MHFSPPNSPFWSVKCATMPDKVLIIIVFTSMPSSCLQGRQYPTASPAIQPGVSSFDSNAEQRLQMALVHFMHEIFVASNILFRNHCVAFPSRCHFVLHLCVFAHALGERRGLWGSVGSKN